jgi:hypothetical protein
VNQRVAHSHSEAVANALIGAGLSQLVLWIYGVPLTEALSLNVTMIGVSYGRAFVLRRIFTRVEWDGLGAKENSGRASKTDG